MFILHLILLKIFKALSRLQPSQLSASVNWYDFNFRLYDKFRTGLQGWIFQAVVFWV